MTDDSVETAAQVPQAEEEEKPTGTMFLALGFLGLIVVLWLWTYAELLGRA